MSGIRQQVSYPIARMPMPLPGVSVLSGVRAETPHTVKRRLSSDGGLWLTLIVMIAVLIMTFGIVVYKRGRKIRSFRIVLPLTEAEASREAARRIVRIVTPIAVIALGTLWIVTAATGSDAWWGLGGASSFAWFVVVAVLAVAAAMAPSRIRFSFVRGWCMRVHPAFAEACEAELYRRGQAHPPPPPAPAGTGVPSAPVSAWSSSAPGTPQLPSLAQMFPESTPPLQPMPQPAPSVQPQLVAPSLPLPPPPAPPV